MTVRQATKRQNDNVRVLTLGVTVSALSVLEDTRNVLPKNFWGFAVPVSFAVTKDKNSSIFCHLHRTLAVFALVEFLRAIVRHDAVEAAVNWPVGLTSRH